LPRSKSAGNEAEAHFMFIARQQERRQACEKCI
jgi:hypothetical protein